MFRLACDGSTTVCNDLRQRDDNLPADVLGSGGRKSRGRSSPAVPADVLDDRQIPRDAFERTRVHEDEETDALDERGLGSGKILVSKTFGVRQ